MLSFPINPAKAVPTKVKVLNPDSTHDKTLVDPTYWTASVTYDTKKDGNPAGAGDLVFHTDTVTGDMFYVDVYCQDVTNLWNWQIELTWDPTILEVVFDSDAGIMPFIPATSIFKFEISPDPSVDNATGTLLMGSSRLGVLPGKSGSDYLARIPFLVKKGAGYLEHLFCDLTLGDLTSLKDNTMTPIAFDKENGYYEIFWVVPGNPTIYLSPAEYKATNLNENVKIDVYVRDVASEWQIVGFQFILSFNASLLEPINYTKGIFMEEFANNGETLLYLDSHDYIGDAALPPGYNAYVVAVFMLPNSSGLYSAPWPEGEGLLVSLNFKAIYNTTFPEIAFSDLNFTYIENVEGTHDDDIVPYALSYVNTSELAKVHYETQTNGTYRAPIYETTPPTIGTPTQDPPVNNVQPNQSVKVSVNVTDLESGVKNVTLSYTNDTVWYDVPMTLNDTTGLWEATIPGFALGVQVKYKIIAYDYAENIAVNDNATSYFNYTVIPEFSQTTILVIFLAATISMMIAISISKGKVKNPSKKFCHN